MNASIKVNLKSCIMDLNVFWGIFRLRSDNDAFGKRAVGMKALFRAGNQTQWRPEYLISVWPNLETQGKVLWVWQDLTIHLKRDAGRFISTPQHCLWNITVLVKANLRTPKTRVIIHWVPSNRAASLAKCHPNSFWLSAVTMTLPWWTPTAWVQAEEGL